MTSVIVRSKPAPSDSNPLALREIRGRLGLRVEPFVARVADDADDLAPVVGGADADPLADRIVVRPVAARRRLVDDGDVSRRLAVVAA